MNNLYFRAPKSAGQDATIYEGNAVRFASVAGVAWEARCRAIIACPQIIEACIAEYLAMRGEGCDDPSHPRHARMKALGNAIALVGAPQ